MLLDYDLSNILMHPNTFLSPEVDKKVSESSFSYITGWRR